MYRLLKRELAKRNKPINLCIIGIGWIGSGLVRELSKYKKIIPKVLVNKTIKKAIIAYSDIGISENQIIIINNKEQLKKAQKTNKYIIFSDINLIKYLKNIDLVYEATGDVLAGAISCLNSIKAGIRFMTINYEMDSTIGLILSKIARKNKVLYSGADGDQPGVLSRMIHEATCLGFNPKIAGNCKGFIDKYQNPKGVKPFVSKRQDVNKICSFADGTKQSAELVSVANAFGFSISKRGMNGPKTTKQSLIKDFNKIIDIDSLEKPLVEYVMGINGVDQGAGVFLIVNKNGLYVKEELEFLKKGPGPYYLFFRAHHLCHIEAISGILQSVLFNSPTIIPRTRACDVITMAKRDLKKGQRLDGYGGFDCYGEIEKAEIVSENNFLPFGLASYATTKVPIKKDTIITYDMVELENNIVIRLRKQQDKIPFST